MARAVSDLLVAAHQPDGLYIGININPAAGQTIPHVIIHLIPHCTGDINT
jgi:diadenosine tetraphosphate (Ap4A) HIT family hydrolase